MSKTTINKHNKFYTGVSLDRDVAEYLDLLAEQTRWNRSLVLNAVVREHARLISERQGVGQKDLFGRVAEEVISL